MTTSKVNALKQNLNQVFDDNLHTKQWHNIVDYAIIGLIIISTLEIFASTFTGIEQKFGKLLDFIDIFTTIVFTIEVSLRIWCADLLDEKYKGVKGRIRYCFSFYGLIDILSTYPFYLNFIIPLPYIALKTLRIARLFRVFRYIPSFHLLSEAIKSKKNELGISLQFLGIITLILSFILFYVEHSVQPETYTNGWDSVVWAFMQYIGDPGGFADYPPISLVGKIIAVVIGIFGIAIFAVPAGLIGSGFTEVMEDEKRTKELTENAQAINEYMLVKSIRREGLFWPAKNINFGDLKLNLSLTEEEVVKSVKLSPYLRVKNLAAAVADGYPQDMLVVNQFYVDNAYGCQINRHSSVTIVNPLGPGDNGLSYFDWHLAEIGGFNYIANELFSRTSGDKGMRYNFYTVEDEDNQCLAFKQFVDDITHDRDEEDWIIVVAGEQVVKNITDFHFEFGGEKGEKSFDFPECITHNRSLLKQLFVDFTAAMSAINLKTDAHEVQPLLNPKHIVRYIQSKTKANVLVITVSYNLLVFDKNLHKAILTMAEVLNHNLEMKKRKGLHTDNYKTRPIESEYWKNLYITPCL